MVLMVMISFHDGESSPGSRSQPSVRARIYKEPSSSFLIPFLFFGTSINK